MRKNTKPHERGGSVLSHLFFCLCMAGKDNGNGVKDGATLQIYNLFGPERDCRAVSGERPPGGHCRKAKNAANQPGNKQAFLIWPSNAKTGQKPDYQSDDTTDQTEQVFFHDGFTSGNRKCCLVQIPAAHSVSNDTGNALHQKKDRRKGQNPCCGVQKHHNGCGQDKNTKHDWPAF